MTLNASIISSLISDSLQLHLSEIQYKFIQDKNFVFIPLQKHLQRT